MSNDDLAPRASDQDREAVLSRLGAGLAEGRLTMAEYEERVTTVLHTRTTGELAPLVADLPARRPDRRQQDTKAWLDEWRYWLGGAVIMIGIWGGQSIADGELQRFWPVAPLAIWAAVLVAIAVWPSSDDHEPNDTPNR